MTISVHTNQSALTALQNLNRTNDRMVDTQHRVSTGLKVNGAKDNASTWAVAQGQRADTSALAAVRTSLDRGLSIADVALAAGETVSDLMNEIKSKVTAASDPSISEASRQAINNDFQALIRQVRQTIDSAEFDGANILVPTSPISFLASAEGNRYITLTPRHLGFGVGGAITFSAGTTVLTLSTMTASSLMTKVNASIDNVNASLAQIGSESKQIEAHNKFVAKLTDALEVGIGNLVDADLAYESARLQALQVQQQLSAQALGIANEAPQVLLSLFRS